MRAIDEKGISLVIFFLITMVAGSIPILLFTRCRVRLTSRRGQTVISLLNCFAGGVFLATCLLNLLVEGLEEYEGFKAVSGFDSEYPFFHLGIGVGFFAVAFVERLAGFLYGRRNAGNDAGEYEQADLSGKNHDGHFVTVKTTEMTPTDKSGEPSEDSSQPDSSPPPVMGPVSAVPAVVMSPGQDSLVKTPRSDSVFTVSESGPTLCAEDWNDCPGRRCSVARDPGDRFTARSGVVAVTLLLALSFHTIFDGLAVGLQDSEANIWTTTAAISVHKTLVAVSLGLELGAASPGKPWKAFLLLFLFALMAPLGVAIGIGVTSDRLDQRAHLLAGGILQGVATGSFLYVTFFEILGEELGHHSTVPKILLAVLGFGLMAVAKIWDAD
ncbi:zinc transporter ZIP3-like [Babylonia areolata]|uniref:zinc transporter ZIP3-like n=1 Tax=Babylonia areolata TaxID=304850 RepID=UPI003FD3C919